MFLHILLNFLHLFTHAHYLLVVGFFAPIFFLGSVSLMNEDGNTENDVQGATIFGLLGMVCVIGVMCFSYFRFKGEEFHLHTPTTLTYIEMVALVILWTCIFASIFHIKQKEQHIHRLLENVHQNLLTPSFSSKDSASFFQDHCTLRVDRIQSGMKMEIFYKENLFCSFSYTNGFSTDAISNDQIRQYIIIHRTFFSSLEKKMWKFDFSFPTTALTTALNELSSYVAQLDRSKLTLEERLFFQQAFEEELPLIHQTFLVEHEEDVKEVLSFLTEKVKTRVQEQKQTEKESQDSTLQQSIHRIYKKGQEFMK